MKKRQQLGRETMEVKFQAWLLAWSAAGLAVLVVVIVTRLSEDLATQSRIVGGFVVACLFGALLFHFTRKPKTAEARARHQAAGRWARDLTGIIIFVLGPLAAHVHQIDQGVLPLVGKVSPLVALLAAWACGAVGLALIGWNRSFLCLALAGGVAGIGAFGSMFIYAAAFHRESMFKWEPGLVAGVGALPGLLLLKLGRSRNSTVANDARGRTE